MSILFLKSQECRQSTFFTPTQLRIKLAFFPWVVCITEYSWRERKCTYCEFTLHLPSFSWLLHRETAGKKTTVSISLWLTSVVCRECIRLKSLLAAAQFIGFFSLCFTSQVKIAILENSLRQLWGGIMALRVNRCFHIPSFTYCDRNFAYFIWRKPLKFCTVVGV